MTITKPSGYKLPERFVFGAFSRSIERDPTRFGCWLAHDHCRLPVGRAVESDEERPSAWTFKVARKSTGDDLLELV